MMSALTYLAQWRGAFIFFMVLFAPKTSLTQVKELNLTPSVVLAGLPEFDAIGCTPKVDEVRTAERTYKLRSRLPSSF